MLAPHHLGEGRFVGLNSPVEFKQLVVAFLPRTVRARFVISDLDNVQLCRRVLHHADVGADIEAMYVVSDRNV